MNKVLILEDERALRNIICAKLEKSGIANEAAASVDDAVKLLESSGPFHAVWLDHYLLGQKDGLDFVKYLRDSKHKELPVYVVSNSSSDQKVTTYLKLGVEKYYIKSDHRLDEIVQDVIDHLDGAKESAEEEGASNG